MTINDRARKKLIPAVKEMGARQCAKHLGISDAAVYRWISGESTLGAEKLIKLANFVGYEIVQTIEIRKRKP